MKWTDPSTKPGLCPMCNVPHLKSYPSCRFKDLDKSLANHEPNTLWKNSKIGKRYAKDGYYSAMEQPPEWHKQRIAEGLELSGEYINCIDLSSDDNKPRTANITVKIAQAENRENPNSLTNRPLDTGTGANFISDSVVKQNKYKMLNLKDNNLFKQNCLEVCGATNSCINITQYIILKINITNEHMSQTINIMCFIGPFKEELIIGLRDIRWHNLILAAPDLFFSNHPDSPTKSSMDDTLLTSDENSTARGLRECVEDISALKSDRKASTMPTSHPLCCDTQCMCCKLKQVRTAGVQHSQFNKQIHTAWQQSPTLNSASELVNPNVNSSTNDNSVFKEHIEPCIEHEYGHWIKLYQMRPSNAPPSVMEAIRETTSFNSNYARQAYEREDIWEIPDDMLEAFPENLLPSLSSNKQFSDLPTNVNGSPKLQAAIHELLGEFQTYLVEMFQQHPRM